MAKLKDTRVYGNLTIDDVLLVSQDATVTGNLTVLGTTTTVNSTTVTVEGPIVQQGAGANGASLQSDDGKDRGLDLSYYAGGAQKEAFMGWNTANSTFALASNVSISGDIVTFNTYGNLVAGIITADGGGLSNIVGSNVTGNVALSNNSNYAGQVTGSSQSNITSVGTLTGLDVSGQSNLSGVIANGAVSITNTTVSTSDTTGALKVAGGAGVVGNLWVGGTIYGNISGSTQAPGADTDIVFNDGGTSNATAGFTFNKSTNTVTVGSNITLSGDDGVANIGGNINLGGGFIVDSTHSGAELYSDYYAQLQFNDGGANPTGYIYVEATGAFLETNGHSANLDTNGVFSIPGNLQTSTGNFTVDQDGNVNAAGYGSFSDVYITNASNSYVLYANGTQVYGDGSFTYDYGVTNTLTAGNIATENANISGNITTKFTGSNLLATDGTGNVIDSNVNLSGGILSIANANIQNLEARSLQLYNLNGGAPIANGILFTDNGGNVKDSSTLTYTSNTLSAGNITTAGTATVANLVVTNLTNNEIPFANATSGISSDASFTYTAGTGTFNAPNITANSNITTSTGTISGANIVDTSLTGTEVVFAGTGGKLQGDASFTYTAGTLTANMMNAVVSLSSANIYDTDLNLNSVVFAAAGGLLTQDSGFAYYISNSTLTANNVSATNTVTAANVLAGNIGNSTSTLYGNGINISNIAGANVSGTVANANYAAYAGDVVNSSQSNITSVGTLTSLSVSATGSITGANLVSANYVTGTLTTNAQPNITSVGTLSSLAVTANVTAGNLLTDNLLYANGTAWDFAKANGAATDIQFKSSSGDLQGSANFTYDDTTQTFTVGGNGIANVTTLNATTGNITTVNSTNLNATGDIVSSSGNIHANIDIQADGNVNAGSTVNTVDLVATGNANITGYMKAGDTTITGNLVVTGTTTSVNTTTTQLEDPLIDLGLGANGAALTNDDGKDRGMVLHTYNGSNSVANDIFMGWKDSLGAFVLAQNVTVTSSVVDYGTGNTAQQANLADLHLGNIYAYNANFGGVVFSEGNINLGNGSYLNGDVHGNISGNIKVAGANGSIQFATNVMEHLGSDVTAGNFVIGQYYKIDATGTTNFTLIGATNSSTGTYFTATGVGAGTGTAKPSNTYGDMANDGANLEYVGGNLTVNVGNGGYVITDYLQGTLTTNAQPNITSVGTLSSLAVTANVTAGNIKTDNLLHSDGTAWDFVTAAGSATQIQYSNGTDLSASANLTFDDSTQNLTVNGNIITGTGSGGNISGANVVTANYFSGDGSNITGVIATSMNAANLTGNVLSSNVTDSSLTSVGILTSLEVTNDITTNLGNLVVTTGDVWANAGTVKGRYLEGTLTVASNNQSNITTIGTLGNLSVTDTANVGNIASNGVANTQVVYGTTGNVLTGSSSFTYDGDTLTVGNANVTTTATVGNLTITSSGTVTGNIIPSSDKLYNLGNSTNAFKDLWLSGTSIHLGSQTISSNSTAVTTTADIAAGNIIDTALSTNQIVFTGAGNLLSGNSSFTFDGSVLNAPNANITSNLIAGNVTANSLTSTGIVVAGTNGLLTTDESNFNYASGLLTVPNANVTSNLTVVGNVTIGSLTTNSIPYITSGNVVTKDSTFTYDGTTFKTGNANVSGTVNAGNVTSNAVSSTQVVFGTTNGRLISDSGLTYTSGSTTLTANNITVSSSANLGGIGNVTITGGTDGQYLVADGSSGGLKWASVDAAMISNGTSNVNIATTDGDVTISVAGTANVVDISSLGMTVTGVITATGNITGNNLTSNNFLTVSGATDATSAVTGAVQVAGGLSAQGNIYTGHAIGFANTPGSNTSSAAYIQFNATSGSLDFIFN